MQFRCLRVPIGSIPFDEFPAAIVVNNKNREVAILDRMDASDDFQSHRPDLPFPVFGFDEHIYDRSDPHEVRNSVNIAHCLLDGSRVCSPFRGEAEPTDLDQLAVGIVGVGLQQGLPALGAQGRGQGLSEENAVQPYEIRCELQPETSPPAGPGRRSKFPNNIAVRQVLDCTTIVIAVVAFASRG